MRMVGEGIEDRPRGFEDVLGVGNASSTTNRRQWNFFSDGAGSKYGHVRRSRLHERPEHGHVARVGSGVLTLRAVGNERIVLNVLIADIQPRGPSGFMLVESEVIKVMHKLFVLISHDHLQMPPPCRFLPQVRE